MPTDTEHGKPTGDTMLTRAKGQPNHPIWKTIHVAVVMASVTGFLSITSKSWEVEQEGYIIGGMALVMIVYAFGGDGLKVVTGALSRFTGNGRGGK